VGTSAMPPGTLTATLAASGATTGTYVAKFDANGLPIQTTVIGGGAPTAIALGPDASIYVTGVSPADFTTANAFQPSSADGLAARLEPDGTAYIWSTYVGGSGSDTINGVAVDSLNNAWLVGYTTSGDFPTKNPTRTKTAATEIVTLKLSSAGQPLFGTFLGDGHGFGVAVDSADNTYLTGDAATDFATTPGPYKTTPSGH